MNHPVVALTLTLFLPFLPGIASVYNRQYAKGGLYFAFIVGIFFAFVEPATVRHRPDLGNSMVATIASFMILFLYLIYMGDSISIAQKLRNGEKVWALEMF